MKYTLVFFVFITLTSCKYFDVEKTTSEAILNEELKAFNWNDVDTYPSFSMCDSLDGKYEKMYCFQYFLKKQIFNALEEEGIVVTQDVNDTVNLKFQVSETGVIDLVGADMDSLTKEEIPNLESLIIGSLDSLPKIYPAIKRMMQVKTEFDLPIVINVD
ncbi:hypothetical protein [Seonamhaeicola marinus]|uniref:Uncharacterized protein n=1 Tax=Seonamhaeicola marinus TaxID=1912246 RepID=A0A5D0HF34_9FLAO|nr:hypothetical protein [Seonamhaeicola marinus]TYA69963.1 hypothetical protein FUA24_21980 [Seonamhaeicola marinus]